MTKEELDQMKATPGMYLVRIKHPLFGEGDGLIVASIGGKLYGMVADNPLNDEGWNMHCRLDRCIYAGGVSRIEA